MENNVNFKQERDFGQIINSTFNFIRHEFRPLSLTRAYLGVPAVLIGSLMLYGSIGVMGNFLQNYSTFSPLALLGAFFGYLLLVIGYLISHLAVFAYIKLYIRHGSGNFTIGDVWQELTSKIAVMIGAGIVIGMIVVVGFVFCIIPGVYLMVALSLFPCLIFFEDASFSDAFSRSMKLVNMQWWKTFGVLFISAMIVGSIGMLFAIPTLVMTFMAAFNGINGTGSTGDLGSMMIILFVFQILQQLASVFLNVISIGALTLQYHNLVEVKERPSLSERIDQIS